MNVILFGCTGMVGQGVLRECLLDPSVQHVLSILRSSTGQQHAKLTKLVFKGFFDLLLNRISSRLRRLFFLRGPSSSGMSEESYSHVIYDMNLAAAHTLVRLNPTTTFTYVSGAGTDSTEQRRTMGGGVKGKTGNAPRAFPAKMPTCSALPGSSPCMGLSQGLRATAFSTQSPNRSSRC